MKTPFISGALALSLSLLSTPMAMAQSDSSGVSTQKIGTWTAMESKEGKTNCTLIKTDGETFYLLMGSNPADSTQGAIIMNSSWTNIVDSQEYQGKVGIPGTDGVETTLMGNVRKNSKGYVVLAPIFKLLDAGLNTPIVYTVGNRTVGQLDFGADRAAFEWLKTCSTRYAGKGK